MTEFCFFDKDARKELKRRNIYVPDVYRNVRSSCNNNDNLQGVAIAPSTGKLQYYYHEKLDTCSIARPCRFLTQTRNTRRFNS